MLMKRLLVLAAALLLGVSSASAEGISIGLGGSGGGSGGITIGQAVSGGTPSTNLYVDSSGNIANSAMLPFAFTIAPATPGNSLTLTNGTITTSRPMISGTETWNAGAVTFTGLKFNFTDTASAAGSLFLDLQNSGVSAFQVRKSGLAISFDNRVGGGGYSIYTNLASAIAGTAANVTETLGAASAGNGLFLGSSDFIAFAASGGNVGTVSAAIRYDAANTLAQRNGTNPQAFNIYNTYTDASNYEAGGISWTQNSNIMNVYTAAAGTGTARSMTVGPYGSGANLNFQNGSVRWKVDTNGHFLAQTDNTYDIGASGATRPRTIYAGTSIVSGGSVTIAAGSTYLVTGRGQFGAASDGVWTITNAGFTDFGRLQFGGTTSSFPALKRSTTVLQFKLADDSAFTSFTATTGILNALTSDAAQTDATVCADATTGQLYKGSGTLGICLGTSSARYKHDIAPLDESCQQLAALDPKTFRYLKGYGDDGAKEQRGFLAEDVENVLPGIVGLDGLGRPNSVDMLALIPIMVNCIKQEMAAK